MSESAARRDSGRVVILDRDGTIVVDRKYLSDPDGLEFEAGAAEGLRSMYESGCRLVVVTNQSGIGRGLFSHQRLREIHDRLLEMVESVGAKLEGIYYCPHVPDERCRCRKPGTALCLQAARELGFAPSSAFVIGDKDTDVEFGRHVGATTILLATDVHDAGGRAQPDFIASNLIEAAAFVARGNRRTQ